MHRPARKMLALPSCASIIHNAVSFVEGYGANVCSDSSNSWLSYWGRTYSYHTTAVNAAGTRVPSGEVAAVPLPAALAAAPSALTGVWKKTRNGNAILLKWAPVPGATGYVIYRTPGATAEFKWPTNFLTALLETTYTDEGITDKNAKVKGLDNSTDYSYQVTAVNAGGISAPVTVHIAAP